MKSAWQSTGFFFLFLHNVKLKRKCTKMGTEEAMLAEAY
jgi:hypothetical protein